MRKSSKHGSLFILASTLFFFSCLKDEIEEPEIGGPDPLSWDYMASWIEIEKRVGGRRLAINR